MKLLTERPARTTDLALLALRRHARRLLGPWDRPDSPGATLGVVRDGALVVHEAAGMASLEHAVPIGPETRFRVASVSKQFTCAVVLMLAAEGRLSVEDPLHRHLPWLPDFGAPVTLDDVMRNVSGIRDMLELMRMGGSDLSQPRTEAELLAAIGRQRSLNFPPRSRFRYSNSGFLLLGKVIEAVEGAPLATVLDRRIFGPLGMSATKHTPDLTEVIPGLATGYLPKDGRFIRAQHGFPLGGEGGLVSSVEDLALWDQNWTSGKTGGLGVMRALAEAAPFTNGVMNRYARGVAVSEYRGIRTIDHGGLWPGYKTLFLRLPDRAETIIAIANHGGIDPVLLATRMADALIEGAPGVHPVPPMPALEGFAGCFLAEDGQTTLDLSIGADGTPVATQNGVPLALVPAEGGALAGRRGVSPLVLRGPEGDGLTAEGDAGSVTTYRRVPPGAALPAALEGRYGCAELDVAWTIAEGPEGLALSIRGPCSAAGPWPLEPVAGEAFRIRTPGVLFQGWLDARAERSAEGTVFALWVSGARASGLRFSRLG